MNSVDAIMSPTFRFETPTCCALCIIGTSFAKIAGTEKRRRRIERMRAMVDIFFRGGSSDMVFLFGGLITTNLKNSIYFPWEEFGMRRGKKGSDECGERLPPNI